MLIVGELIKASRRAIAMAIEAQDQEVIQKVAKDQFEAGANDIDVNAGVFVGQEVAHQMAGDNRAVRGRGTLLHR